MTGGRGRLAALSAAVVLGAIAFAPSVSASHPVDGVRWTAPVLLRGTTGIDEPRAAFGRNGTLYVIASLLGSAHPEALVFRSLDGGRHFARVAPLPMQDQPSMDLDLVSAASGRLIATELDARTLTARTAVSDDGGRTWAASLGMEADMDRPWLATGPSNTAYLVWHNFYSGLAGHEMLVQSSTDGGASFGPPVPAVPPQSAAFADLSCGDSTGPSSIAVDQRSGRIYVSFATRTSAAGGCGQAATTSGPRFNVVPSTRVWVATSPDGSAGSWSVHLVADTSASDRPLALQYAPLTVLPDGAVALTYTEGAGADDYASDVRVVTSRDAGRTWSSALTVPNSRPALFPLVGGDAAGDVYVAYLRGHPVNGHTLWYPTVATLRGSHVVATRQLSTFPSHEGSPAMMSAACGSGPTAGLQQALLCNRYLDDFGLAVTPGGAVAVTWPAPFARLGGRTNGVYVATAHPQS